MKLLWAPNIEFTRALKAAAGDKSEDLRVDVTDSCVRFERAFPLLVDESGRICRQAFEFLYDLSADGSSYSSKTISTYAECLCDWLTFAQKLSVPTLIPNSRRLAQYRGHLSGTDIIEGRKRRQLSKRTINLRLTVASEFAKFHAPDSTAIKENDLRGGTSEGRYMRGQPRHHNQRSRLLVKVTKKRPRVLSKDAISALLRVLRQPHRLAFQWQLCTGLRRGSVVALRVDHIEELCHEYSDGFIDVPAKGSQIATVYVPPPLLDETLRYIQIERTKIAPTKVGDPGTLVAQGCLFLNANGRPLTAECYYRAFHRASGKISLRAKTHLARSTYASRMEEILGDMRARGENIDPVKVVQGLLGHSDSSTTKLYLDSIVCPNISVLKAIGRLADSVVRGFEIEKDHE